MDKEVIAKVDAIVEVEDDIAIEAIYGSDTMKNQAILERKV